MPAIQQLKKITHAAYFVRLFSQDWIKDQDAKKECHVINSLVSCLFRRIIRDFSRSVITREKRIS
jgi:hypothetical protein